MLQWLLSRPKRRAAGGNENARRVEFSGREFREIKVHGRLKEVGERNTVNLP
jgi:hypothetical protein